MSFNKPEKGELGEGVKIHRIRITLTSRKVQALEKGASLFTVTAAMISFVCAQDREHVC